MRRVGVSVGTLYKWESNHRIKLSEIRNNNNKLFGVPRYIPVASRILSDTDTGVSPASGNSVALPAADNGCDVARPKLSHAGRPYSKQRSIDTCSSRAFVK